MRILAALCSLLIFLAVGSMSAQAQDSSRTTQTIVVGNMDSNSFSVLKTDGVSQWVERVIPMGGSAFEMKQQGEYLYIACWNRERGRGEVSVYSLRTWTRVGGFPVVGYGGRGAPFSIALTNDMLYVADWQESNICQFRLSDSELVRRIQLGDWALKFIHLTADGRFLYATGAGGRVHKLNVLTGERVAAIDGVPYGRGMVSVGDTLFVANESHKAVTLISIETDRITDVIDLSPFRVDGPKTFAYDAEDETVLVACAFGGLVGLKRNVESGKWGVIAQSEPENSNYNYHVIVVGTGPQKQYWVTDGADRGRHPMAAKHMVKDPTQPGVYRVVSSTFIQGVTPYFALVVEMPPDSQP